MSEKELGCKIIFPRVTGKVPGVGSTFRLSWMSDKEAGELFLSLLSTCPVEMCLLSLPHPAFHCELRFFLPCSHNRHHYHGILSKYCLGTNSQQRRTKFAVCCVYKGM